MVAATLWIEITIAGFVYVLGLSFFLLPPNPTADLKAVLPYKDLLPYLSLATVGVSYVVGVVFHRLITAIALSLKEHLVRAKLGKLIEVFSSKRSPQLVAVWQFGSPRLQREIDFHFGLLVLLRSLLFSIPLLAVSSTLWATKSGLVNPWHMAAVYGAFWVLSYVAHHLQVRLCRKIQNAAIDVVTSAREAQSGMAPPPNAN
jgi:hypothetical protein